MNEIGKRIKSLRKEMGWTGEQLGKKMGITKTGVSYWETGKTSPDNKALIKLADLFGVSLDYLMGRTDTREEEPQPTAEGDEDEISEEEIYTIAAHRVGHEGPLTGEEMERIKMALKIALAKNGK